MPDQVTYMFPGPPLEYPTGAERERASALIGQPITTGNRAKMRSLVRRWYVRTGRPWR